MSKLRSLHREFISNLKTSEKVTNAKRNLILSILKSTTTKREAKNYLNKYQNQFDFSDLRFGIDVNENALNKRENQRDLFINRFLNHQNPFIGIYDNDIKLQKIPLRIAVFKIKFLAIDGEVWKGISETFSRLVHLGISPIILLDYDHLSEGSFKQNELYMINQVNKVMNFLGKPCEDSGLKTTVLRSLFTTNGEVNENRNSDPTGNSSNTTTNSSDPAINSLELILIPLYQGIIPIIQPVVYNTKTCNQEFLSSNDLLFSLTSSLMNTSDLLSIEKVVMIDPIGGIPSVERNQTSHVFINLSQEYSDIISELYIGYIEPKIRDLHINNLSTINNILNMISKVSENDDTTGIITTPQIMSMNDDLMNPIIYNVLTDRPIISSSLPSSNTRTPQLSTSIIKKGAEVQIFDQGTFPGKFTLENLFDDEFIDKAKFVNLINDSFGKELDTEKYFSRVNDSLATVILVGDYDGAALITWESSNEGNIAYLDKFAISKKNQGLPGLADVIFKIILQSHPFELIWRSRKNNPVNKWYFERCCGSLSDPDSQWKIFFTGEVFDKKIDKLKKKSTNSIDIGKKMVDYSKICESIEPSFKQL